MFEGIIRRSLSRTIVLPAMTVLFFASIASGQISGCPSSNSNVTSWHNDNCRTGWQQNEQTLTQSNVAQTGSFGLLWQWQLNDHYGAQSDQAYAQPLAVGGLSNVGTCSTNCNVLFVATEQDYLYAFQADSTSGGSSSPLWTTDLAGKVGSNYGPVDCNNFHPTCVGQGVIAPLVGVTGTPVISTSANKAANILYVVSAVQTPAPPSTASSINFYLHAINIVNGNEENGSPMLINPTGLGVTPTNLCGIGSGTGALGWDPTHHIQRSGLLLVTVTDTNNATHDIVYVAFAPVRRENENGWILGYTYDTSSGFSAVTTPFVTTPYGSGGGVWGSGAAPAYDGTYIYTPTGNGTFNLASGNISADYGDSMLKLAIGTSGTGLGTLSVSDYYTPSDYSARCTGDLDFGSGGVMLVPDAIVNNYPHVMLHAEKESYLWMINRDSLGGVNGSLPQPPIQYPSPNPPSILPGYWSSPAYVRYVDNNQVTNYQVYFAPDEQTPSKSPYPMNMFTLTSTGLSTAPTDITSNSFCAFPHAPTPAVSTSNTDAQNTVIVWAVESSNPNNPTFGNCSGSPAGPAVLWAYDQNLNKLYTSNTLQTTVGQAVNFPVPTVFNKRVYIGTKSEIDVFGLCNMAPSGKCLN